MAIVDCPECGGDVSTEAESCPRCGCVLNPRPTSLDQGFDIIGRLLKAIALLFVLLLLAVYCSR